MNQLSDHHPYFFLLNLNLKKQNALHQVKKTNCSQPTVENFCNDIHDSCLTDLNSSLQQDPSINCNVLESVISEVVYNLFESERRQREARTSRIGHGNHAFAPFNTFFIFVNFGANARFP